MDELVSFDGFVFPAANAPPAATREAWVRAEELLDPLESALLGFRKQHAPTAPRDPTHGEGGEG